MSMDERVLETIKKKYPQVIFRVADRPPNHLVFIMNGYYGSLILNPDYELKTVDDCLPEWIEEWGGKKP